jgi:HK97 family phage major capsid protein
MGATRVNTSEGGPLLLPTLKTHAVGTQVAVQTTALSGTDPAFGQVALNAYRYGELVDVSNDLIRDSVFDIAAWLGRDIGRGLGRAIDVDLIKGAGSTAATGYAILAGAGTNAPITSGGSLIAPSVEKYIDLVYSVNDEARNNGASWLMKDSVAGTLRKYRDGSGGTVGAFLWQPSLTAGLVAGQPDTFLGYPVFTDPNMDAAGSAAVLAVFGDPSEYAIRTVGNPVIESDTSFRFSTDQTSFRGKWAVGGNHTQKSHVNSLLQNV